MKSLEEWGKEYNVDSVELRLHLENKNKCRFILYFTRFALTLQAKQKNKDMTAIQMGALNAEILRNLGTIAEDEDLLTRLAKYLRKLVVQKKDPTLFTKEEFFARIDEARKQPGKSFANVDELDKYIRSL